MAKAQSTAAVKCRPVRTKAKPGVKPVKVKAHERSTPSKLPKCK